MDSSIFKALFTMKIKYLISLPKGFDGKKQFPMIVFLHGSGERGDDISLVKINGIPKYIEGGADYPAIVLSPQCPDDMVWNNFTVQLKQLIDFVADKYCADRDAVSITGLSMGGYGTWEMAISYPDYFSAAAPICGGGFSWRCDALRSIPVRAFHGAKDNCVPLENSVEMVTAARVAGCDAELTVFPDDGHNSWDSAYLNTDVINWLITQRRNRKD